jgi:hypothetical protein
MFVTQESSDKHHQYRTNPQKANISVGKTFSLTHNSADSGGIHQFIVLNIDLFRGYWNFPLVLPGISENIEVFRYLSGSFPFSLPTISNDTGVFHSL